MFLDVRFCLAEHRAAVREHDRLSASVVVIAGAHAADIDEFRREAVDLAVWSHLSVPEAADGEAEERERDVRSDAARCGCHGVVLSRAVARAA
jgi:hypothetical protein